MGSRAKLADVPKLHELITNQVCLKRCSKQSSIFTYANLQIRRALMEKGTWKVVLPGLASVAEVKEDIKQEHDQLLKEEMLQ